MQSCNIDWTAGIPPHYLIADASGRTVLVEFYEGEMVVVADEDPWHLMTNHLRAIASEYGGYRRYRAMHEWLTESGERFTPQRAMGLLDEVSQGGKTQWSAVYDITTGDVDVAMGMAHDRIHSFHLNLASR